MPIKDIQYYLKFDLESAATKIQGLGLQRRDSQVFADAINSLSFRSERSLITSDDLRRVLGEPDRVIKKKGISIWQYDWNDSYGPTSYSSSTPFLIVDGVVKGLADDSLLHDSDDSGQSAAC